MLPNENPGFPNAAPQAPDPWGAPPPENRDDGDPSLPAGLLIGLAMMAAALVVGGGLFLWQRDEARNPDTVAAAEASADEDATEADEASGGSSERTASDDEDDSDDEADSSDEAKLDFEPVVCPPSTEELFCELAAFVERARGRPFKDFPVIELAEDEEFAALLLVDFDEDTEELERYGEILRTLGLIEPDDDIVALFRDLLAIGVVGFYDTETGGLVVRGGEFNLYAQSVLVHELVHAHDDQWIGLDRPELDDVPDERDAGFLAVQEGNAERVTEDWSATLTQAERQQMDAESFALIGPEDLQVLLAIPPFLVEDLSWPYVEGVTLMKDVVAEGGEDAADAAFENPPRSTEQILHPEQYEPGEAVVITPTPDFDGTLLEEGVIGEVWFRSWLGITEGNGWGSDRFVHYESTGGELCTRIDVVGDTDQDTSELRSALESWASQGDGRTVEVLDDSVIEDLPTVRATGCV